MTTKYAILNPMTGAYSFAETEKAALTKISDLALDFYLSHTHNTPMSIITVNENGDSTWIPIDISPSHVHVFVPTPQINA
jgi:hypothetical protein